MNIACTCLLNILTFFLFCLIIIFNKREKMKNERKPKLKKEKGRQKHLRTEEGKRKTNTFTNKKHKSTKSKTQQH